MFFDDLKEINAIGKWWVPGRNQPPHPGTLHFSPEDGPSLKLFDSKGFLTKPDDGIYTERSFSEFFPLVCGRTEIGSATLIRMRNGRAEFLISDALFESEDEARFRRVQLQFQHLSEWVGQPIVHRTISFWNNDKGEPIFSEVIYRYCTLPEEKFSANGLDFKIIFGLKTKGGILTPVTLYPMVYLEIVSFESKSVREWWFEVIRPMRDLFSFATDRPIDVTQFYVIDEREEGKREKRRVFFKGRKTNTKDQELLPEDMLFVKSDIHTNLDKLIGRWFDLTTDLPVVCNLYSSVISIREQYLEEEFLSLAQAAELYHRSRFNNAILPKAEWKEKVRKILDTIPNSEQKWLKEKLAYSNAPTLQTRLDELLNELEPTTTMLVADRNSFSKNVKDKRNYFTHWDVKRKDKAALYPDLYFVTRTLRYLIAACLLRELGFSSDQTAELFNRNHRINNFRWDSDNLISKKPVQADKSACFSLKVEDDSAE